MRVTILFLRTLIILLVSCVAASSAFAQNTTPGPGSDPTPRRERVFVNGGYGIQTRTAGFNEDRTMPLYAEEAMFGTTYAGADGPVFGGGGGVRVWRDVWVGVAAGSTSHTHDGDATARLPHPFRFNAARTVDAHRSGLRREETSLFLQVMYRVQLAGRVHVSVFAGPARLKGTQDLIDRITWDDTYPYEEATLTGMTVVSSTVTRDVVGFGAQVDVNLFGPLSIGLDVRRAATDVDFSTPDGRKIRSALGGTQALVNLRAGF